MRCRQNRQDRVDALCDFTVVLAALLFLASVVFGKERNVEVVTFPEAGSDLAVEIAPESEVRSATPIAATSR